jgi:hypothetical protein
MAAQEQSLELARRAWSESLQQLLRDQPEDGRTALEALASAMAAMERALQSQEATNRALRQSLDAYREVIERAGSRGEALAAGQGVQAEATGRGKPESMRLIYGLNCPLTTMSGGWVGITDCSHQPLSGNFKNRPQERRRFLRDRVRICMDSMLPMALLASCHSGPSK